MWSRILFLKDTKIYFCVLVKFTYVSNNTIAYYIRIYILLLNNQQTMVSKNLILIKYNVFTIDVIPGCYWKY